MTFTTEEREHLAIREAELPERPITQEQREHLSIAENKGKSRAKRKPTPRAKKGKA